MELHKLITNVQQWSIDRGLDKADSKKQMLKLYEEFGELASGLAKGNKEVVKDSIGDVVVVLIILAQQLKDADKIRRELNKPVVPQFVANWYEEHEGDLEYNVEKEKRYLVKIKSTGQCLGKYYINNEILSPRFIYTGRNADGFTRKELEEAGFGWVFDCEGIEVEEVEE